ncbi:hypothetical protein WJX72_012323 [[Myrmecia] bisecta]|uniref:Uncharacterized protein n=1 Tax=[Myrmecia] bisecta TaxID=41462 RepID=A0AAW1PYL6_9CHLO
MSQAMGAEILNHLTAAAGQVEVHSVHDLVVEATVWDTDEGDWALTQVFKLGKTRTGAQVAQLVQSHSGGWTGNHGPLCGVLQPASPSFKADSECAQAVMARNFLSDLLQEHDVKFSPVKMVSYDCRLRRGQDTLFKWDDLVYVKPGREEDDYHHIAERTAKLSAALQLGLHCLLGMHDSLIF